MGSDWMNSIWAIARASARGACNVTCAACRRTCSSVKVAMACLPASLPIWTCAILPSHVTRAEPDQGLDRPVREIPRAVGCACRRRHDCVGGWSYGQGRARCERDERVARTDSLPSARQPRYLCGLMKFAYKRFPNGIERPIIPVIVRNPATTQSARYLALVDSGADVRIFAAEIGELIGLDVFGGRERRLSGVVAGETRPYYVHEVEIQVGALRRRCAVGFMPDLAPNGHGLLG